MQEKILITGASGMIGTRLTERLLQRDHEVVYLGRSIPPVQHRKPGVSYFTWDLKEGNIQPMALDGVTAIVHLAGANINGKRWTKKFKEEIIQSRIQSAGLIFGHLKKEKHTVHSFVSASGVNYYGDGDLHHVFKEEDPKGEGFLAEVASKWEAAANQFEHLGLRVVKIRTGVVLSSDEGALPSIARPVRWGVGAPLGSGKQPMSWIHVDDLCKIYEHIVTRKQLKGTFNAVAPHPVSNRTFTVEVARLLHRPLWVPAVPGWALRLLVGQVAEVVLGGTCASSEKIENAGYIFRFPVLDTALKDLL